MVASLDIKINYSKSCLHWILVEAEQNLVPVLVLQYSQIRTSQKYLELLQVATVARSTVMAMKSPRRKMLEYIQVHQEQGYSVGSWYRMTISLLHHLKCEASERREAS
jgi:hypothetical protein